MQGRKKGRFFQGLLFGTALSAAVILATGSLLFRYYGLNIVQGASTGQTVAASGTGDGGTVVDNELVSKLQWLEYYVNQQFLMDEEMDAGALKDGIYKGFMDALGDPYSCYYTKEEYDQMQESTSGIYSGIGVMVSQDAATRTTKVVRIFENSPGAEAGLLPGDILVEADGVDVSAMELSSVVSYIKGEEGTGVRLKVYRESVNDYVELEAVRRKIEVPTVEYRMMDDSIGYVAVTEFDSVTAAQYRQAVEALKAQGMKGLVVDIRDNPGGLLNIVVEMLDYMLPEGRIVYTEDKNGKGETYTSDAGHFFDLPLAVLVNGNSASASEIFAGAIQDYGIGTIVGTTTFGKGIVQHLYQMSDGTAIKLTVSRYFTPNGNCIHEIGIKPDLEVELAEELLTEVTIDPEEDNQLQAAVSAVLEKLESGK